MTRKEEAETTFQFGARQRKVRLRVGERYVVAPMNTQARKHRGREVTLEGFNDDFMPSVAAVRFSDTGRSGKVPCADLAVVGTPTDVPVRVEAAVTFEELEKRARVLAPRLEALPTPSRMKEWKTLFSQLGRATTAENKPAVLELLTLVIAAGARGIAKVQKRDVRDVIEELRRAHLP